METTDKTNEQLEKAGFAVNTFSFLKDGGIPEDCDILVLMGPTSDLTKNDINAVKEYISGGGNVVFFTSLDGIETPEYDKLISSYGVSISDGMIFEGDLSHTLQNLPYIIIPDAVVHQISNSVYSKKRVNLLYYPKGFVLSDVENPNITVETLLQSTPNAYQVHLKDDGTVEEKEETGILHLCILFGSGKQRIHGKDYRFCHPVFPCCRAG